MPDVFAIEPDGNLTPAEHVLELGDFRIAVIPKTAALPAVTSAADSAPGAIGAGEPPAVDPAPGLATG